MEIIVLIKQVPDMDKVKFDKEKGVIDRKSAGVEVNPFDLNALEAAVNIKEKIGGKVIALSMGPARAEEVIKEALARGADEGILLNDKNFSGADTISTSKTLAAAINRINSFDLITAGVMTVDGDTAQVGPQTAEFLNIPHIPYVSKINQITEDYLTVTAKVWKKNYIKKMKYPGLITVTKDMNNPRLPSFKDKMKARKTEINKMDLEVLELNQKEVGLEGSPTRVSNIEIPADEKREGKIYNGEKELNKALTEIFQKCEEKNLIGG